MAGKPVTVKLTSTSAVTIDPWVVEISKIAKDSIKWQGRGCRIRIEPDHPEHFSPELPQEYDKTVKGAFAADVPLGTHHYQISVLELEKKGSYKLRVYRIDPDYKVDR